MEQTPLLFQPAPSSKKIYLLPIEELAMRANENDVNAQLMLGLYYYKGMNNTFINYDLGRAWIAKAAVTDPASAAGLCAQGLCFKLCIGDIRITNLNKAKTFFEQAAAKNFIPAKHELAVLLYDEEKANKSVGAIHQQANPDWGANLKKHTEIQNINEIRRDKFFELFTSCAEENYPPSLLNLAFCYYDGFKVLKNYHEAFKYTQMAADLGLAQAKRSLGVYFENGHIGPKNDDAARKWYRAALDQNYDTHEDLARLPQPCCRIL